MSSFSLLKLPLFYKSRIFLWEEILIYSRIFPIIKKLNKVEYRKMELKNYLISLIVDLVPTLLVFDKNHHHHLLYRLNKTLVPHLLFNNFIKVNSYYYIFDILSFCLCLKIVHYFFESCFLPQTMFDVSFYTSESNLFFSNHYSCSY